MLSESTSIPTGVELKQHREARGLSILELAKAAGVKWQTIQDWESGKRKPQGVTVRQVMKALAGTPTLPDLGTRGASEISP